MDGNLYPTLFSFTHIKSKEIDNQVGNKLFLKKKKISNRSHTNKK